MQYAVCGQKVGRQNALRAVPLLKVGRLEPSHWHTFRRHWDLSIKRSLHVETAVQVGLQPGEARHSIVHNSRRLCLVERRHIAATRRLVATFFAFLTLWPWPLTFWPNINWWARYSLLYCGIVMDYYYIHKSLLKWWQTAPHLQNKVHVKIVLYTAER